MSQNNGPSRKHYDEHYPLVRKCAGLPSGHYFIPGESPCNLEDQFEIGIRAIFNSYWSARRQPPTIAAIQGAIERYCEGQAMLREGQAMVREAMQSLSPLESEIDVAAQLADLAWLDRDEEIDRYLRFRAWGDHLTRQELEKEVEQELEQELEDNLVAGSDVDARISERDRGVKFLRDHPDILARLLKREVGDYRKDAETALVVEPSLDLLDRIGFTPTKKLTRKAFFDALFDLLGIERKRRPTPASISVIVDNRKKKSRSVAT
jgi:hypothetical protein